MPPLRIAYILQYFPHLTETFIADEIRAIRGRGVEVRIVSLLPPRPGPVSPTSRQLLDCTWYAPGPFSLRLWLDQARFLRESPRLYWSLLSTFLRQPYAGNRPALLLLKRIAIFLKAVSTAAYLRAAPVDLVHAHFAWLPAAAAWISARLLRVPFTVTVHAFDLYSKKNELMPLIAREAAHLIAISEFNRAQLSDLRPNQAEDISVIHCGIDLRRSAASAGAAPHTVGERQLRILSVGSLVAKKGHTFLIAACRLLADQGMDFTCTIIGGGPDESALRRQIQDSQLAGRVILTGALPHDDILAAYRQYDLFVLACVVTHDGDRDGIPVVLMEAANAELAAISTYVSGIPELVLQEKTGLLVPPEDPTALADAIRRLASDPGKRRALGRNARRLMETQFDLQATSAQLEEVFRRTYREVAQESHA